MMTGIPIENNLWTAYLLTIFFVVAGFAVYDVLYRRVPDRALVFFMSTMPKSFVKLRISCKLVSATTMTKPWKDAKRNEPKSPTAAMSGKMPFC